MNNLNNNQLTGRAFAYQAIQGQPDQRSSGSSIPSNVVNVTEFRNFANNYEAQSYINRLLNRNGAHTATISHAYRFPGSPADIMVPPAGTQSRAPVPNYLFSSSRDIGQPINLCGPIIQAPNTADTLMVVGTVLVPDRQPHPSFGGSQNGAGSGGNFAPPMTPVARRPSMSPSGSSYSCFGNSTPGSQREELVCSNGLCPVCGSVHTPSNSGAISSASSDYGSESSYYGSSESGYQSSSGASSTGLTTGRLCRNCNSYAPRKPDIFPEGYCLYCADY